jgi:hypothetical protein
MIWKFERIQTRGRRRGGRFIFEKIREKFDSQS